MFFFCSSVTTTKKELEKNLATNFLILSIATTTLNKKSENDDKKVQPFKVPAKSSARRMVKQKHRLYTNISVVSHEMWL